MRKTPEYWTGHKKDRTHSKSSAKSCLYGLMIVFQEFEDWSLWDFWRECLSAIESMTTL